MFGHLYTYRIKSLLRGKVVIFWSLVYPIILSLLFYLTFGSHVGVQDNAFEPAEIAVVSEEGALSDIFLETIENVEFSEGNRMFIVNRLSEEEAKKQLLDGKVYGIVFVSDDITLSVRGSGLYQSILKTFTDTFLQNVDLLTDVYTTAPEAAEAVRAITESTQTYIKKVSISGAEADNDIQSFYNIIAMACLFGCFIGVMLGNELQANASPLAARKCMGSVHRFKMITADMLAAFTLDFIEVMIVSLVIRFVFGVNIMVQPLYYIIIVLFGTLIGVAGGQFIAVLARGKNDLQIALSIAISLVCCFLSGLMVGGIDHLIEAKAPIINRINPAALIVNAFYCLSVYTDYERYTMDMVLLLVEAVVLTGLSYLAMRRVKHESI